MRLPPDSVGHGSLSDRADSLKLLLAKEIPSEALHSKHRKTNHPRLHALLKNERDAHRFGDSSS